MLSLPPKGLYLLFKVRQNVYKVKDSDRRHIIIWTRRDIPIRVSQVATEAWCFPLDRSG